MTTTDYEEGDEVTSNHVTFSGPRFEQRWKVHSLTCDTFQQAIEYAAQMLASVGADVRARRKRIHVYLTEHADQAPQVYEEQQ